MAELSTKQKILNASIRLFNENGLANVRLQQIAGEIGISVGNLAYHFRNKEAILEAVAASLNEELLEILSTYRIYPNLIDFDNQLSKYFSFIEKYPFYFLDLLEVNRTYPEIKGNRQHNISKMISQIRKRFDFNKSRGLIMPEPKEGIYDEVAETIWVLITFWIPQNLLKGRNGSAQVQTFKSMVWTQMYPFFTEQGKAEFEQLIMPLLKRESL